MGEVLVVADGMLVARVTGYTLGSDGRVSFEAELVEGGATHLVESTPPRRESAVTDATVIHLANGLVWAQVGGDRLIWTGGRMGGMDLSKKAYETASEAADRLVRVIEQFGREPRCEAVRLVRKHLRLQGREVPVDWAGPTDG